jgi:magnesium-transporting ATPase (P-type)
VFNHYGIKRNELWGAAPQYFPAENDDAVFETSAGELISPERQDEILASVQSAYYFTIAITQFFTAYILKATDHNVWCSPAAWRNKWTYLAMVLSTAIAFFVTFTPGVQTVLGSNTFPLWALAVAAAGGFLHVCFEGVKRIVLRKVREGARV